MQWHNAAVHVNLLHAWRARRRAQNNENVHAPMCKASNSCAGTGNCGSCLSSNFKKAGSRITCDVRVGKWQRWQCLNLLFEA